MDLVQPLRPERPRADKVMEGVAEWQARPLDRVYPVVFVDAINVQVRDGKVAAPSTAGPGRRRSAAVRSSVSCETSGRARGTSGPVQHITSGPVVLQNCGRWLSGAQPDAGWSFLDLA